MDETAQRVVVITVMFVIAYWKRYELVDYVRERAAEEIRAFRELVQPFWELAMVCTWKLERKIDPNGIPNYANDVEFEGELSSGDESCFARRSIWARFRDLKRQDPKEYAGWY